MSPRALETNSLMTAMLGRDLRMLCTWRFPRCLVWPVCLAYLLYLSYPEPSARQGSSWPPKHAISLNRLADFASQSTERAWRIPWHRLPCSQDVMGIHTTCDCNFSSMMIRTEYFQSGVIGKLPFTNSVRTNPYDTHLIPDDAIGNLFSLLSRDRPPTQAHETRPPDEIKLV